MSEVFLTPEQQIRQRHAWFEKAKRLGNVTLACRRLGVSRKTFYKWRQRFAASRGARQALLDRSRRPHRPRRQVKKALRRRLLQLRQRTHLGPARLRRLLLARGVRHVPSARTIGKLLKPAGLTRRRQAQAQRYRRVFVVPRPGDLVQLDVKWVPYLVEGRQLYPVHGHRLLHAAPRGPTARGRELGGGQGVRPVRAEHLAVSRAVRPDG